MRVVVPKSGFVFLVLITILLSILLHTTSGAMISSNSNTTSASGVTTSSSSSSSTTSANGVTISSTSSSSSSYTYRRSFYETLNFAERQALVGFYNSTVAAAAAVNSESRLGLYWNLSNSACSWIGVYCNPSGFTVLYLSLAGMSLVGVIPSNTIGKLSSLRVLSLRNNNLSGEIPYDFGNLTDLRTVYLNDNQFSGKIPSSFFTLPYLTRLNLENNSFSGPIPDMIKNADTLTFFNVSYNKLVSRIPSSLSNKFPASAFSNNTYLCGPPVSNSCNDSYQFPPSSNEQASINESSNSGRRAIFGIYSGSTMLILILLGSLGKTIYNKLIKPHPSDQSSNLTDQRKKLLKSSFDDEDEDHGFDFDDLLKTTAEVLGEGSTGTTFKQVLVGKNKTVVVKILKDVEVTDEDFRKTMEVLGKMKNKYYYVVPLRAFYNYSSHQKLLVYDYMPAGSLSARLHGCSGSVRTLLDWDHRMRIALNVAKGLEYLHVDEEIVHGNITSSNIFLKQETSNGVSLSDYGLNKLFCGSSSLNHRVTGYRAPEVLDPRDFTFASDVYSFGVFLLELLTRKIPNLVSLDTIRVHFSKRVDAIIHEEPKVELFDVEIMRDDNIEKMEQLWRIAKNCVLTEPKKRPLMCNVVSMIENM